MFNCGMRVRRDFGTGGKLNPDCEGYGLVHRPFNDGNFGTGWQPRSILPLKVRWCQHRVSVSVRLLRICLRNQEEDKTAQEGGGCCDVFHELSPSQFSSQSATAL